MFNNLIQPNLNLSFYKETNFYTFKIKDFLNEEQYKLLNDNFPRFPRTEFKKYNSQFDNNDSEHRLKAFITEVDPKSYTEHVTSNPVLNEFVRTVKSKEMINVLLKNFFFKILYSRRYDFKNFFKLLLRKNFPCENILEDYNRFLNNRFITTVSFVSMLNGAQLFPHTDGMKKMLTLMLYLPDEDYTNDNGGDLEIGTSFYNSSAFGLSEKNINNHIKNFSDAEIFRKKNKSSLKFPFTKKNVYGFIKSHNSWHGLEELDIHENFIRRNININLLMV